eukprot:2732068-Prymnesium_polylepis.1
MQLNECTAEVVAGATIMLMPGVGISFSTAGMTSAHGRCHTFDARADGYARGEATGAMALTATQITEMGVVGSAVRQDGKSASLTAPNGQAQKELLGAAWLDAAVTSEGLTLDEAHGTGTALGDPIETGSLVGAVHEYVDGEPARPTVVSGVKANIGHAEPAAGMTGLLKLAFGMRRGVAAPNAQLRMLNPHVVGSVRSVSMALPTLPLDLSVESKAGGVSSFGYSGTIAHVVLRHAGVGAELNMGTVPLIYHRRAFLWRAAVAAPAGPSMQERAAA